MKKTNIPARISRFEKLGFGLFLHYGVYSLAEAGEWIRHFRGMPYDEYSRLAGKFKAEEFDARAIARLAREAGMRYACLTTRHHDGFSLYDTCGLDSFDAPRSAARRDLVSEFVEGCRAEGVVPFFYHTLLDWRWETETCTNEKFEEYLDYLHASVEILCCNYGKIGGLWFDGSWSRPGGNWKEDRLYATIRRHQPEAIIVNNTGLEARGASGHPEIDSTTYEQGLPSLPDRSGHAKYLAAEMCETLNGHWGSAKWDFRFKGPATIIENLCACRKVGANYLLNVGPGPTGKIGDYESALLRLVGRWIADTDRVLYEGIPVASAACSGRDFILQTGSRFFYFAHDLVRIGSQHVVADGGGNGRRTVKHPPCKIDSICWLDDRSEVPFRLCEDDGVLTLDCAGYDYGADRVVRVAEITPSASA